jgi:hypothetical protein
MSPQKPTKQLETIALRHRRVVLAIQRYRHLEEIALIRRQALFLKPHAP